MLCFRRSLSGVAAAALALAATAAVSAVAATPAAADIVIHVTNGADSGPGSYRQAIITANTNGDAEPDIIEFDEDLSVVLTSGNVAYTGTQPLRLNGHGSSIDGSGSFQILSTANAAVTVDHLTVQHGAQPIGGAMSIGGSLTILKSTFRDNSASIGGAIITGSVKITDSTFTGNRASIAGAILASDAEITGSEFSHNSAAIGGALVLSDKSEISHSEFTSNRAELGVGAGSSRSKTRRSRTTRPPWVVRSRWRAASR
jgi:hypothetical protein